jgi:hypothetical protein
MNSFVIVYYGESGEESILIGKQDKVSFLPSGWGTQPESSCKLVGACPGKEEKQ